MYRSWRINTAKCYADVFSEPTTTTPAVLQDWWSYMIHSILPPLWSTSHTLIHWSKSHALQNAIYIVGGRSIQPQLTYFFRIIDIDNTWKGRFQSLPGSNVKKKQHGNTTVDGRNPAPVDVVNFPLLTGFHTCWLAVWDFWTINSMKCRAAPVALEMLISEEELPWVKFTAWANAELACL